MKSGLGILIRAPEVPFPIPIKLLKRGILAILGVPKMALRVPESKFQDNFLIQTSPQNPPKTTTGTSSHILFYPLKIYFRHLGSLFQCSKVPNESRGVLKLLQTMAKASALFFSARHPQTFPDLQMTGESEEGRRRSHSCGGGRITRVYFTDVT